MSQHLNMMYRSDILGRLRQGFQMFDRIAAETAVVVCRAVCTQVAIHCCELTTQYEEFV
jgi:ArsR family transcriptional regulator